jgi:hypothetical protein
LFVFSLSLAEHYLSIVFLNCLGFVLFCADQGYGEDFARQSDDESNFVKGKGKKMDRLIDQGAEM